MMGLAAWALCMWVAQMIAGCSPEAEISSPPGSSADGAAGSGDTEALSPGDGPVIELEGAAGSGDEAAAECVPPSCEVEGGRYCGQIGDGCGNVLDCGSCSDGWVCEENVCVGGPDCVPSTECQIGNTTFCGTIGRT